MLLGIVEWDSGLGWRGVMLRELLVSTPWLASEIKRANIKRRQNCLRFILGHELIILFLLQKFQSHIAIFCLHHHRVDACCQITDVYFRFLWILERNILRPTKCIIHLYLFDL